MRPPTVIRISVPRRHPQAVPPRRNAAHELLLLLSRCETLFAGMEQDPDAPQGAALRVLSALPPRTVRLARDLAADLAMDAGQLSRILTGLETDGLIARGAAPDKRQAPIRITASGRLALRRQRQAREQAMSNLLEGLSETKRNTLADAVARASGVLNDVETPSPRRRS